MLRLKDIHYSVDGTEILKGVNMVVRDGEIHSIIGVNGTGKTTIAAIIMGLGGYQPQRGKVLFENRDITNLSVTERARLGITLAWQIPANFEGISVREYLSLGYGTPPDELLRLVGLDPRVYLNRSVDENLSGGERKRIELASVLSINPKLVILDEPDSGIDMASIDVIKRVVKRLKREGSSVLLITHNEKMSKIADSVSLLCNGIIVKEGDIGEVTSFFGRVCKKCDHVGDVDEGVLK